MNWGKKKTNAIVACHCNKKVAYLSVTLFGGFRSPKMLEKELFLRSLHFECQQR